MLAMELKSSITTLSLLLLLLLLAAPYPIRGRPGVTDINSEVYEIDYRGPETHSYIPPPTRFGGRHQHHESVTEHPIPKGLRGGHFGGNGKK